MNMSGDPAQEYFVDGMTDLLTNRLSSISSLHVISRTSAMSFKGVNKPLAEIAAALKVDAIVEGSVTRDGERVRVTVQIIHAGTDVRLWGNLTSGRPPMRSDCKPKWRGLLQTSCGQSSVSEASEALIRRSMQSPRPRNGFCVADI